ncbi:hypothetical protein BLSTO_06380, partial [Blastocystis sp. subtype 1]
MFACQLYAENGLSGEAARILRSVEEGRNDSIATQVRVWNERARVLFLSGKKEEAWQTLRQAKLYAPGNVETRVLEAGALLEDAKATLEELKELREDEETTLDVVLSREHGCTKQLLEAEQILHSLLQEDQRLASVWGMWGEVLALLGNREKAAEAMLTSLEWSEVNSFESVSRYPVVICGCLL